MMMRRRIFDWLTKAVVCLLVSAASCVPVGEEVAKVPIEAEKEAPKEAAKQLAPVTTQQTAEAEVEPEKEVATATSEGVASLVLKFAPGDSTRYRVITESEQSVKWEGSLPEGSELKGGRNHSRVEIIFTRTIQSVADNGNAVAEITFESVKYYSKVRDKVVLDFDNATTKDPNHPLAMIVGQSYTIELTPTGDVRRVIDANDIRIAARRGSVVPRMALALLRPDTIERRHRILALSAAKKRRVREGDTWSRIRTFDFGMMGSKSYEKVYTVKEIKDTQRGEIAVVEMNGIPTAETAEQLHKEQRASALADRFESSGTYTGQLILDVTHGKVEKYVEQLQAEWVAVTPSAERKGDKGPAVLKMGAGRLHSLEKID